MIPAGIEPATFRFVVQHLNHCATASPVRVYARVCVCVCMYTYIYYKVHFCVINEQFDMYLSHLP